MAVDLRTEFTRPLALILLALAGLGWVLFVLSSWSSASLQKVQRHQIMEATERSEKLAAEVARFEAASGDLAELQKRVAATREDLTRVSQAKTDMTSELAATQQRLAATRRDLTEVDRTVQAQAEKLSEMGTGATEAAAEPEAPRVTRSSRRGRWSRRGRASRSYSIISRSR